MLPLVNFKADFLKIAKGSFLQDLTKRLLNRLPPPSVLARYNFLRHLPTLKATDKPHMVFGCEDGACFEQTDHLWCAYKYLACLQLCNICIHCYPHLTYLFRSIFDNRFCRVNNLRRVVCWLWALRKTLLIPKQTNL